MSQASAATVCEAMVAASGLACASFDAERQAWALTPGFAQILGLAHDWFAWSENDWFARVHQDDAPALRSIFERLHLQRLSPEVVMRLAHANGSWRWCRCRPLLQAGQRMLLVHDETEARQERAALVDSQMRLRSMYNAAPVAIVLWTREGRITDWNVVAETLFGHARDAVIGQKLVPLLVAPSDYAVFAASVNRASREHVVGQVQARALTAAGGEIVCDWRTVALRGPSGILLGMLSLALDVSATLAAEEQLRKARDQAEALSRAKTEFLALIGHEMRTPLNGVLGMAQLLEETVGADDRELVTTIRQSGEGLLRIINGMLEYTDIDVRDLASALESVSLDELGFPLGEALSFKAAAKGIAFHYVCDPLLRERLVIGDRRSIEKILRILLENALKFTEQGEIRLGLRVQEASEQAVRVSLQIEDSGIGIDPALGEEVFQPFRQGQNAITRRIDGVGMGLALAKKLVDRLGGEIFFAPQPPQGTRFVVNLTLALAPAA